MQSLSYLIHYLNFKKLKEKNVQVFLISAKTPNKNTLDELDFVETNYSGVYKTNKKLAGNLQLLIANDLSDAAYNVLIKLFASKKIQKNHSGIFTRCFLPFFTKTILSSELGFVVISGKRISSSSTDAEGFVLTT